ncbi:MAG: class I SAM-dependent methyltransferase [Alphaproteobacteria bacterium]|nr:class I SAM-dependent methyltransferase [Alphaproteobacteria bacterium]
MEPLRYIIDRLPANLEGKHVVDYACGSGRHGRLALARGARVTFVDHDISKLGDLQKNDGVEIIECDLEQPDEWPLEAREFDIAIVTNYLFRPRLKEVFSLLPKGGHILYQTFALGNEKFGRPSNPEFLLKPFELKDVLPDDFELLDFAQGEVTEPKAAVIQRLHAIRR